MKTIIDQISEISEKMLEYSQQKAWDLLMDAEKQRKVLLIKFQKEPIAAQQSAAKRLQEILTINQKIEAIAKQEKDKHTNELVDLKKKSKNISAYL